MRDASVKRSTAWLAAIEPTPGMAAEAMGKQLVTRFDTVYINIDTQGAMGRAGRAMHWLRAMQWRLQQQ